MAKLAMPMLAAFAALTAGANADPGTPGVPQAPISIYTENLQNRPGPDPIIQLDAYTGVTGQTYTAHPNWLIGCNGWIASANQSTTAAEPVADCANGTALGQDFWNRAQQLSWALGLHAGQSQAVAQGNYGVSAYTSNSPGAGLVEFETATNIAFPTSNRFVSFSVDVAAINCSVSAPLLQFSLVDDANTAIPAGSQINGCASSTTVTVPALGNQGAVTARTGTYSSNGAVLISGASVGVRMVNNNGNGRGNDHAFDNISILDATPQLDKEFSPTAVLVGETSTLTFTITNTSELGAKNGWSFTDTLPAGLTVASEDISTNCPAGVVTAPLNGSTIDVSGNLTAGMASCTATVEVRASASGTYTNDASNITSSVGINPPGSTSLTVTGQTNFGFCDSTIYLSVGGSPTQLHSVDTSTNPFTFPPIGAPWPSNGAIGYNGIGYSPNDNYIYTARWNENQNVHQLLRIGGNGSVANLGSITGGGINTTPYQSIIASGVIGADGFFYIKHNHATNLMWRVNVTTRLATAIPLNRTIQNADFAWHDGLIYTHEHTTDTVYAINPNTGAVTTIGTAGLPGSVFGSMVSATNGIFGRENGTGGFYQFDPATGAATLISSGPAGGGDGAKCPTTPLNLPSDLEITKDDGVTTYTPGTDTTYTITVTNNGPFGVQNARVEDPLPAGVTIANWTCEGVDGGVCGDASGTGAIDTTANLPVGASVTYTLSMGIPSSQTGNFTNTATVTAPEGSVDPDLSNNTASDTDTMAPPPTSGACSPVRVTPALSFSMSPLPAGGTVQRTGAPNGWNPDNPWSTFGGNYTFTWTFTTPVPANWIQFAVYDVHHANYQTTPPTIRISLGAGGTATTADFSLVQGWHSLMNDMTYNASTGALGYTHSTDTKSAAGLRGNSANTVKSITITATNINIGDHIVQALYAVPACLTVSKVSEDGTGSFQIDQTNVVEANGTAVPSTTLTTTEAGTPVSSAPYHSVPGTGVNLSEVVPAGWNLTTAICTDQNAGNTGNPTSVGTFDAPTISIPGENVRPQSDLQCVFTNEVAEPALEIEKTGTLNDLNGNDLIDPGETITYSFLVTNTGNVTLTDVTVNDPLLADAGIDVEPEPQTLAPGGSVTFEATYQPTQADIDSGSVTNTATGTGTPPGTPPIESPPDEVTVPPNPESELTIEKTGTLNDLNGNDLIDPGETITYSFLVTNNGAVTLSNVTVNDPLLANAGISVTPAPQTLAPGASVTFTATYEPTQADIDSGSVTNTATGTGTPPDGPPTESPPDEVTIPPNEEPGLTIEKTGQLNDLNGNDLIDPGETITYSFLVRNTGAVTLTDVTVDDPMLADAGISVSPGPQTLAPGGSVTFRATYQPTQADIDSGSVTNTATGTGTPPDGPPIESPPDEVTVPPNPESGLTIEKTGQLNDLNGNDLIDPGETITYSFLVTNTGAVTMTDVTVSDPMLEDAGISVSPGPQTLAPGGSVTFSATYEPTQADIDSGSVTNVATGIGTPPDGPPIESPPDEVTVPPNPEPGLVIEKTGTLNDANGNELIDLGETITYSFLVTNNGAVTLTDVTVDDPMLADAGISVTPGPQTLAPGESVTFSATYEPTQADIDSGSVTNTATGIGTPPDGPPIESPPDTVTVPPDDTPGMSIEKTGTLNDLNGNALIDLGETITYSFLVTNTGNVTLTDVTVDDPLLENAGISVTPGPQTLAPGGSVTFTATYQPTQADIDAGSVTNTATGIGTPPDGPPFESPPDEVTVPPNPEPGLVIEKTGQLNDLDDNELLDVGETITYSFLVTNTGAVTLTDVTVNDPLLADAGISVSPEPQTLAPGESVTFTATYAPTDAEIEAGSVTNTATGIGTPPDGPPFESPPDTVTVPEGRPGIGIVKTGEYVDTDGNGYANAGDELRYTFVVTNTGNILLSDVRPVDEGPSFNGVRGTGSLSAFTPTGADLRPGEEQTFTATYALTQADIDNGAGVDDGVENTASAVGYANGDEITGRPIESDESIVVIALPAPDSDVSIIKIADLRYIRRGEQAPFTIRITNNGAMPLDGFTVTDTLPAGFRYVDGSATVDGVEVTPVVSGRQVVFENLTVGANSEMVIRLRMLALSSAGAGKHTNRASIRDRGGNPIAPDTDAVVEILVEPIFDCGDIIGKVFDDVNRNGYQDDGEPGMPGVRIATAKGWLVTTDQYGRFHVPCAALPDNRIGSNFIMKLDERTLPTGYRLTTENPRVVRLTAGKMTKLNFGVSIGRVVRLDLKSEAFEAHGTDLKTQWAKGVDQLIALLRQEQSVLRLSYIDAGTDDRLAEERVERTKQLITERWRRSGGQYRLEIETRVEVGQ